MNELDEIMSGAGETVSASTEPLTTQAPATVDAAGGPIRDESGRFASQQQPQEGAGAATTDLPAPDHQNGSNGVPVAAVQAEREKRKQAESALEEMRNRLALLESALAKNQTAQPQQKEEQAPATIWDNPDGYLESRLNPVQQQLMEHREFVSETLAVQVHGAETVEAAKKAIEARAMTPEGQAVIRQITQSRHPFDELVKWHKQQAAIERVGNDPDAWLQAELEKRMADPAFQAQVIERARAGAPVAGRTTAPITNLPPSLSRMPGGANAAADNDMSDGAIFSHAFRG